MTRLSQSQMDKSKMAESTLGASTMSQSVRKPYVEPKNSFMPEILERSKKMQRDKKVEDKLLEDTEQRRERKEKYA